MEAFCTSNALEIAWTIHYLRHYLKRHGLGSQVTVSMARKNGYFSAYYANLFADYCVKGWRVV
ncbi:MAG: hypothetical protein J5823_03065 [Paludibacteraceae bacterium]|nr:hypothetical protein [Paludibacteraceae bacterium]